MGPKTLIFLALFLVQVSCEIKSSLTFVMDDTGSMYDEMAQLKMAAKSIVDIVLYEASQIEEMLLVTFNNPSVTFWKRTRDANEFKQALNQVRVHGGWCSEMSLTGTKLALEESLPGSYLFVFTDAGARDMHLVETVISLCQVKQSQIVFVLTGDTCETTAVYSRIAMACNGQVLEISEEEIGQVLEYVKEAIKEDRSVITKKVVPPRQLTNVPFTIYNETVYALVSASGKNAILKVKDNSNREVYEYTRVTWTKNVKVLKLINLRPGTYVAQVYGSTNVNVMIFMRTDFTFEYVFSNSQENSLRPTIGTPTHLTISLKDGEHSVTAQAVQLLDVDENVLATLPLTPMGGNIYSTQQLVPPGNTFKVAVTAISRSKGRPLRRIAKTWVEPIRPVTVAIASTTSATPPPGADAEEDRAGGAVCCGDGSCPGADLVCDGTLDCADGADEALELCRGSGRPLFALILLCQQPWSPLHDALCPEVCGEWPKYCYYAIGAEHGAPGTCVLPQPSKRGAYSIVDVEPRGRGPADFSLAFACPRGYRLQGERPRCVRGTWTSDFPTCVIAMFPVTLVPTAKATTTDPNPNKSSICIQKVSFSEVEVSKQACGI